MHTITCLLESCSPVWPLPISCCPPFSSQSHARQSHSPPPSPSLHLQHFTCISVTSAVCRAGYLLLGERQKEAVKPAVLRPAEHHRSPTSHHLCFVEVGTEDKMYSEIRATMKSGQPQTRAVISRFKHNFITKNKMKIITNCRLQM